MPLFSISEWDKSTFSLRKNASPRSFLNQKAINSLARKFHLQVRERKMDFGIMVGSALELGTSHRKEHMVTIESLRLQYEKDSDVHISSKCFHNRLDQTELSKFGNELVTAAVKAYGKLCGRSPDNYCKELIDTLGVSDIILIDGTEISVRNSLSAQCECKGKLHAGLKLHVAFSLKKQSFEYSMSLRWWTLREPRYCLSITGTFCSSWTPVTAVMSLRSASSKAAITTL